MVQYIESYLDFVCNLACFQCLPNNSMLGSLLYLGMICQSTDMHETVHYDQNKIVAVLIATYGAVSSHTLTSYVTLFAFNVYLIILCFGSLLYLGQSTDMHETVRTVIPHRMLVQFGLMRSMIRHLQKYPVQEQCDEEEEEEEEFSSNELKQIAP